MRVGIAGRSLPGACPECSGPAGPQPRHPGCSKDPLAALSSDGSATCWMPRNPAQPVPVWGPKSQMWKPKIGLHSQAVLRTGSLALGRRRLCFPWAAVLDGGWGEGQVPPSACSSRRSLRLGVPQCPLVKHRCIWPQVHVNACAQLCPTLSDPMDCSLPGSFVHEIFAARILQWVAISSKVSSRHRDRTLNFCVSCIGRRILHHCATWETHESLTNLTRLSVSGDLWGTYTESCFKRSHQKGQNAGLSPGDKDTSSG